MSYISFLMDIFSKSYKWAKHKQHTCRVSRLQTWNMSALKLTGGVKNPQQPGEPVIHETQGTICSFKLNHVFSLSFYISAFFLLWLSISVEHVAYKVPLETSSTSHLPCTHPSVCESLHGINLLKQRELAAKPTLWRRLQTHSVQKRPISYSASASTLSIPGVVSGLF